MKSFIMLSLVALFLFIQQVKTQAPTAEPYAVASFYWPASQCKIKTGCVSQPPHFRIHGVWPTNGDGSEMIDCEGVDISFSAIKRVPNIFRYWPNLYGKNEDKAFWSYEWNKHGKCSQQSVQDYFTNSAHLYTQTGQKLVDILKTAKITTYPGIPKAYKVKAFYNAVKSGLNLTPILSCKTVGKDRYFVEVRLCVTFDLKTFRNCPTPNFLGCGLAGRFCSLPRSADPDDA